MVFKEIGHLAFRVRDYKGMQGFYRDKLKIDKSFCLHNKQGEERIGYFGLPNGHFIEMFPLQPSNPHGFVGDNSRERHSFQYGWLSEAIESDPIWVEDVEQNQWKADSVNPYAVEGLMGATFYCKKYENMKAFYKDVLGLTMTEDKGQSCCFTMKSGQHIELIAADYIEDNRTENRAFHHMALLTDNILKAARILEDRGILLSHGSKLRNPAYTQPFHSVCKLGSDGSYAFYFSDPEDNEIEAMQYTEDSMQLRKRGVDS